MLLTMSIEVIRGFADVIASRVPILSSCPREWEPSAPRAAGALGSRIRWMTTGQGLPDAVEFAGQGFLNRFLSD
jgi:hypothetical protein